MKTILIVATAAIVATLTTFGQGQGVVTFTSIGAPDSKKIVGCDGTYCSGTAYAVALYWGPATATDDRNLIQTGGSASFLTGANAGTYFGGGRTITTPGSAINGPVLTFQVRAWMTATGNSYDTALIRMKGPMFQLKTKDPTNPLETAPNLWQAPGYVGFQNLSAVCPEPSTITFGLLGAAALVLLGRRKSS